MKKIFAILAVAVVAVALTSCEDDKMCRCVYEDGGEEYFDAEENENCSSASFVENGKKVICSED